jgi:hypothetical protein
VAGGWRKLSNEFHNMYTSLNVIRVIISRTIRWERHVARMEEMRSTHSILVEIPEGKRPLERPRRG